MTHLTLLSFPEDLKQKKSKQFSMVKDFYQHKSIAADQTQVRGGHDNVLIYFTSLEQSSNVISLRTCISFPWDINYWFFSISGTDYSLLQGAEF